MRRLIFVLILCASFFLSTVVSPVFAQETASKSAESVFLAQKSSILSEKYDRSVFVTGGQVILTGQVHGDLVVIGGAVRLRGQVDQDVYVLGGSVFIDGVVNGNVVAAGSEVRLSEGSQVKGDVIVASSQLATAGRITGSLRAYAHQTFLGGTITGNVKLSSSAVTEASNLAIVGQKDITLWQTKAPSTITWQERLRLFAHRYLLELLWRGVLLLFVWKVAWSRVKKGCQLLQSHPVKTFFDGISVGVSVSLVSLFFLIILFGFPLFLIGVLSLGLAVLTGWLFVIPWIGPKLLPAQPLWLQTVVALGAVAFFTALPVLGWLVQLLLAVWGVGVWWALLFSSRE